MGLITVFDAILTGRQRGQKLQCLYGNSMANNVFKNCTLHNLKFVNRNVKILGRRLYSPRFEGCSLAGRRSVDFSNFPYICL